MDYSHRSTSFRRAVLAPTSGDVRGSASFVRPTRVRTMQRAAAAAAAAETAAPAANPIMATAAMSS